VLAGAIEWLLYDWLMAHRESERSAAIEIRSGRPADAAMIVAAAAALAAARRPAPWQVEQSISSASTPAQDFQKLGRHS
jgi:hypothetical protein